MVLTPNSLQVNPRNYKCGVTSYYLLKAADGLTVDDTDLKNAVEAANKKAEAAEKAAKLAQQKLFSTERPTVRGIKSAKKRYAKFTWKKVSGADGYVIQYGTNAQFKRAKSLTIKKGTATSKVFKKLKSRKKYYMRVRAYKYFDGKKVYTKYSAKKSVRVK